MTPEEAYDHVCAVAREHALILNASGGVVTIVHPDTQRQESLYEHIQWVHGLGKHPDTLERERAEVSNVELTGLRRSYGEGPVERHVVRKRGGAE